ncbi:MAG: hypothetical protein IJO32_01625 [Bacilli bacterium]|nr:hypothetical protein [Bacilli bacterium]
MNENPIVPENNNNMENSNLQNEEIIDDLNPIKNTNLNVVPENTKQITSSINNNMNLNNMGIPQTQNFSQYNNISTPMTNVQQTPNTQNMQPNTMNNPIINNEIPIMENQNSISSAISQTETTNITSNNNTMEMPKETPKKSKKNLIIGLVIVVLVVLVLVFGFFYMRNPKKIFSSNLSKMYNNLLTLQKENKVLSNILNSKKVGMTSNIQIKLNDAQNITKDFSNIGFSLDYREDKDKKEGYLEIDSTLTNKKLISLETILKDNKAYIKLKDVMDKYYFTEYEFISILNNQNNEDYEYLLNILKKHILDNLKKEELKTKQVTEKINNKDEKLEKISLEIKEQLLNKIALGVLEEIKKDDKAINIILNILEGSEINKNDLLKEIDGIITSIKETTTNELLFTYSIYAKNHKDVLKQELNMENNIFEIYNYDNTIEVKYINILMTNCISNQSNIMINCIDDEPTETVLFQFKIIGNETNGEITGLFSTLSIIGKYTNDSVDLTLSDSSSSTEANLKINYNDNQISNTEYHYDMDIGVSILENNREMLKAEINMDSKISSDIEIPTSNTSNSKDIYQMTDEEQNEIMTKIMSIPVIQELIMKYS